MQPQLDMIFPPGPGCLLPEGERLSPLDLPLTQHYVYPREGRPLPSKAIRRDHKPGQKVPVAIGVSPKIALPEPASTIYLPDLKAFLLGSRATIAANSVSGNVSRGREAFAATFPPGLGNSPLGEERPLPPPVSPLSLRYSSPWEERLLPLQVSPWD